ncbi:hypothetical protein MPER_05988 [Moniliophthora perniciosa FA553]|nr:hypothetical protein MPER_05988 [Moniliophthora perniciosa FA553]
MSDLDMLITVNTSLRWEDLLTIAMRYRLLGDGENATLSGGDYGDRVEIVMVSSEDLVANVTTAMGGGGDESDGTTMEPCQQTDLARSDGALPDSENTPGKSKENLSYKSIYSKPA